MDFPWADILGGLGFPLLCALITLAPAIACMLLAQIIRFFKDE